MEVCPTDRVTDIRQSHPVFVAIQAEQKPGDQKVIESLIQKLRQCTPARELWDTIQAEGPVSVFLAGKKNVPSSGFWESETRTIAIDRTLEPLDQKLQWLLFEANNAKQFPSPMAEELAKGDISKNAFLKKIVRAEYESVKSHHKIVEACVKAQGWNPRMNPYRSYFKGGDKAPWATFDKMWKDYLADPSRKQHRQLYLDTWDQIAKSNYCAKHPLEKDCT